MRDSTMRIATDRRRATAPRAQGARRRLLHSTITLTLTGAVRRRDVPSRRARRLSWASTRLARRRRASCLRCHRRRSSRRGWSASGSAHSSASACCSPHDNNRATRSLLANGTTLNARRGFERGWQSGWRQSGAVRQAPPPPHSQPPTDEARRIRWADLHSLETAPSGLAAVSMRSIVALTLMCSVSNSVVYIINFKQQWEWWLCYQFDLISAQLQHNAI